MENDNDNDYHHYDNRHIPSNKWFRTLNGC